MNIIEELKKIINLVKNSIVNDKNYKKLMEDIVKYSTLVIVLNLLFFLSKPNTIFFNAI